MDDYYLKNPNKLMGQPKRTIADYVESQGILVPRRFENLKEARKSHKAILLRSEHTQEYDGVSGLLDSMGLSDLRIGYSNKGRKNLDFRPRGIESLTKCDILHPLKVAH